MFPVPTFLISTPLSNFGIKKEKGIEPEKYPKRKAPNIGILN